MRPPTQEENSQWQHDHPAEAVARLPAAPARRRARVRNRTVNPGPPAFRPARGRHPARDRRRVLVDRRRQGVARLDPAGRAKEIA
ncbi:hypothetical protein [Tautonia marina]|uniref:hypothetical protein n=1 Tax=Tautonia marina TaxID=2653855 RepID=UPI00191C6286|nr:hypothetical protein [Tautonia marina]